MTKKQRRMARRSMLHDGVDPQRRAGYRTHRHELVDDDDKFELTVDVPGVKEDDIDIKLEDGMLTVEGHRTASSESAQFTSKFSKSFSLDKTVDVEKITAALKNGVLTVSAPKDLKKLEENIRRIPVVTSAAVESTSTSNDNDGSEKKTEQNEKEEAEKPVID